MDAYRRLSEDLPQRSPPTRASRRGERDVRAQVAGIPLANPARASADLESVLDELLVTSWPAGERLAAMGHLRAPVSGLCRGIEQQLAAEAHPLPGAVAERAAGAERLQEKLAAGFALALHEMCAPDGKLPRFRSKAVAAGIVAGLVHADEALVWAYRQYATPPAATWRRIHALYGFADEVGLAEAGVADAMSGDTPLSARDAYARTLLLAMGNPYRLSARELQEARCVIACVADRCAVACASPRGDGVDVQADTGPGYVAGERTAAVPGLRAIDPMPAEQALLARLAMLAPGAQSIELPAPGGGRVTTSAAFLQRLCAGWNTGERRHPRLAASHVLDLVFGMHALHFALAGNVDFPAFVRKVHGDAIMIGRHDLPTAWLAGGDASRMRPVRGEVLDQAAGGYRLCLRNTDGTRLRIGEVVGLAAVSEDPEERDWMIGIIRWLRHAEDCELLGVELLRRAARAAGMRPVTDTGETLAPERAVELPGAAGPDRLSLLVTNHPARNVVAAEVALPALASDWLSRATVATWHQQESEAVGPACFRVTLVRDTPDAQG